jgi:hypothetical protein
MTRRAEARGVRPWSGVVAADDRLGEERLWVVWGLAAPPEIAAVPDVYPEGGPPTDVAIAIASTEDPEFAAADENHRWVMLVEGDEDDVDAWVQEHPVARRYAPYVG